METGVREATAHAEELLSMALTCSVQWAIGKVFPHPRPFSKACLYTALCAPSLPHLTPKGFLGEAVPICYFPNLLFQRTSSSSTAPCQIHSGLFWPVGFHLGGNALSPPNRDPENPARSVEGRNGWAWYSPSPQENRGRKTFCGGDKESLSLRLL